MIGIDQERLKSAINGGILACEHFHEGPCSSMILPHFLGSAATMYKMYIPIHIIPFLLFKRKRVMQNPSFEIYKLLKDYIKSLLFSSSYCGLLTYFLCFFKNITGDVDGRYIIPPAAFLSGVSLLFESPTRRQQIALFLVPKVMEALHLIAKRRNLVKSSPGAEAIIFGIAMAIIGYFYQSDSHHIKSSYYSAFKKVMGHI